MPLTDYQDGEIVSVEIASSGSTGLGTPGFPLTVSGSLTVVSGTITANQGTPTTVSGAWPVKITDGQFSASITPPLSSANPYNTAVVVAPLPTLYSVTVVSGATLSTLSGDNFDFGVFYGFHGKVAFVVSAETLSGSGPAFNLVIQELNPVDLSTPVGDEGGFFFNSAPILDQVTFNTNYGGPIKVSATLLPGPATLTGLVIKIIQLKPNSVEVDGYIPLLPTSTIVGARDPDTNAARSLPGYNLNEVNTFEYALGVSLRGKGANGSEPIGVAGHPLTVSGTLGVSQSAPLNVSMSNTPVITGSVGITNQVTITTTGSIPVTFGALGVLNVSMSNTPTITGSVSLSQIATITGSVAIVNLISVTAPNALNVSMSNTPTITGSVGVTSIASPVTVTGSVALSQVATITGSVALASEATKNTTAPAKVLNIGGQDVNNVPRSMFTDTSGTLYTDRIEKATFLAFVSGVANAFTKSMISIHNANGTNVRVEILEINIMNCLTASNVGIFSEFQMLRFVTHSAGTAATIASFDTSNALSPYVTVVTNGNVLTQSMPFMRQIWNSQWLNTNTISASSAVVEHAFQNMFPAFNAKPYDKIKSIVLTGSQGFHVKHIQNSTTGLFDLSILFTTETI